MQRSPICSHPHSARAKRKGTHAITSLKDQQHSSDQQTTRSLQRLLAETGRRGTHMTPSSMEWNTNRFECEQKCFAIFKLVCIRHLQYTRARTHKSMKQPTTQLYTHTRTNTHPLSTPPTHAHFSAAGIAHTHTHTKTRYTQIPS